MKKWIIAIVVIVILALGYYWYTNQSAPSTTDTAANGVAISDEFGSR